MQFSPILREATLPISFQRIPEDDPRGFQRIPEDPGRSKEREGRAKYPSLKFK